MIDHAKRYEGIVRGALKEAAADDSAGYSVSQCIAPIPSPDGKVDLGPAWLVTVTIRNPLLGQPSIGYAYPVPGVTPPDKLVTEIVKGLLRKCREERAELNAMPKERVQ